MIKPGKYLTKTKEYPTASKVTGIVMFLVYVYITLAWVSTSNGTDTTAQYMGLLVGIVGLTALGLGAFFLHDKMFPVVEKYM